MPPDISRIRRQPAGKQVYKKLHNFCHPLSRIHPGGILLSYIYTRSVLNNPQETAMGEPQTGVTKRLTIRSDVIATNGFHHH